MSYDLLPAGACHCGAVQVDLRLSKAPDESVEARLARRRSYWMPIRIEANPGVGQVN